MQNMSFMKQMLFLWVIVVLMIFTSCTKDDFVPREWGVEPMLEISPLATILTPSHPSDTIKIKTNYIDFKISDAIYWVDIKKLEDVSAIIVTADPITNSDEYREGYITISIQRGKYKLSRDFVVMQFKKDVNIYD